MCLRAIAKPSAFVPTQQLFYGLVKRYRVNNRIMLSSQNPDKENEVATECFQDKANILIDRMESDSPHEKRIEPTLKGDRKWWFTDYYKKYFSKNTHWGLDFKVMSYNVLSQRLLEKHPHLYRKCSPKHLEWEFRVNNLLFEIREYEADVICLQEVEEDRYLDTFSPELAKRGYGGLFQKKTRDKFDGCAIFFNKSKFTLVKEVPVEYYKDKIQVLNRDNIGLIAILKPNIKGLVAKRICVATTHLLFNPKRVDVRLSQIRVLLAEIERNAIRGIHNGKRLYHPILLCGDFNEQPYSSIYDFLVAGYMQSMYSSEGDPLSLKAISIDDETCFFKESSSDSGETGSDTTESSAVKTPSSPKRAFKKAIGHNLYRHFLNFVSAYRHVDDGGLKESSTYHMTTNCTVDYIFYNVSEKNWQASRKQNGLIHLGSYGLLNYRQIRDSFCLPNACISSDHTCLLSRFLLT